MDILSWLDGVGPADPQQLSEIRKRKQQQIASPTASTTDSRGAALLPAKHQRPGGNNEGSVDVDGTLGTTSGKALSISDASSCSSDDSRISPTKRLAKLELDPDSPVSVQQMMRTDHRMPAELKTILKTLDSFQRGNGIVPEYLAAEIQTCAEENDDFYNFTPSTLEKSHEATRPSISSPQLSLHQILTVFKAAKERLNEDHAGAAWDTLVHWPVFELALGSIAGMSEIAVPGDRTEDQGREDQIRLCSMPCTAARLTGHARGSKIVDYYIFVEPGPNKAAKINELLKQWEYINHTHYNPLRQRPIVLSVCSLRPSERFKNAQLQLYV